MVKCRDIYLKIEKLPGYSPLASDDAEKILFRRDCMYGHGHEDGKISDSEVALSRLDAIVFREYLDRATQFRTPPRSSTQTSTSRLSIGVFLAQSFTQSRASACLFTS
jgi:hypothetical protein